MLERNANEPARPAVEQVTVSGKIVAVEAGFVKGWIDGVAPGVLVSLFVGRRLVGSSAAQGESGYRVKFAVDARACPPPLFLGEALDFTVELAKHPGRPIDSLTVASKDVLRLKDLTVQRKTPGLDGCVDGTNDGLLRGWVWDKIRPERRLDLLVFRGDRFVGRFKAGRSRPDLAAAGHGDGNYGFEIPIRDTPSDVGAAEPEIAVFVDDIAAWKVPVGVHAKASKASVKPKLRDLPNTVEAFARVLTSTEPFPKKVFVLDKLKHGTMPDAFKPDYVLLAMEFLRQELVAAGETMSGSWRERLKRWAHMRAVGMQIGRLDDLAKTITAGPALLKASSANGDATGKSRADQKS